MEDVGNQFIGAKASDREFKYERCLCLDQELADRAIFDRDHKLCVLITAIRDRGLMVVMMVALLPMGMRVCRVLAMWMPVAMVFTFPNGMQPIAQNARRTVGSH